MRIGNLYINSDIYRVVDRLKIETPYFDKGYKEAGEDFILVQCPYHKFGKENHPSAEFNKEHGWFYCFSCKKKKSLPKVIEDVTGTANGREWLIDNFGGDYDYNEKRKITIKRTETQENKYVSPDALKYFHKKHPYMYERKLTDEIIEKFDIGYYDKEDCLTFPNKDEAGNILFIALRSVSTKMFHYPENIDKPIYGLYELYREMAEGKEITEVYLCESMIDALTIWSWGKYALALNGTGSTKQMEILRKSDIHKFILATDNDFAGRNARERIKKQLKNKILAEIDYESYGSCKDINEFTREQFEGARILKVSSLFKTHTPVSNRESIIQYNPDDTDLQKELVNSLSLMDSHWEKQNDNKDNDTGFIYTAKTIDEVRAKCNETGVDINYALHRWFNTQTSLTCEELFIKYGAVDEENTKDKLTDFYINGEQFDLKLTAYPTELKDAGIDPHTRAGKNRLIEWLYENQSSEGREGYGNRIFIVCNAHTTKEKYYLKTRFDVIEKKIKAYMSYIKNHPFNTVNLIKNDVLYSNIKSDVIYISEDLLEDNK